MESKQRYRGLVISPGTETPHWLDYEEWARLTEFMKWGYIKDGAPIYTPETTNDTVLLKEKDPEKGDRRELDPCPEGTGIKKSAVEDTLKINTEETKL